VRSIIQVGVGGMGAVWADCVVQSKDWEPTAYVDINKKNLVAAAARHRMPKARCFTNLEKALRTVEADALLDVTPQEARKKVCCAAFDHGLDVLAEKPLAGSVADATAIIQHAANQGRTFLVAQNYRYQSAPQTARKWIASGRLGPLGYIGVQFHRGPRFGGFRDKMDQPLVLDMTIHHLDLMRYLLGADIVAVQALTANPPWSWYKGDATAMILIEMDNGAVVNYLGSWVSRGWETSWNADWRVEGGNGVLLWENDTLSFSDRPGTKRKVRLRTMQKQHQACLLDAFARALDTGSEPETSGARNLNGFAATHAVVRAAREKRRVEVAELTE